MGEFEFIAPMVASSVMFISIAAVLILRPLSSKLGDLLVMMRKEKLAESAGKAELQHIVNLIEKLDNRLALLEERQDFADRLLESRRAALSADRE